MYSTNIPCRKFRLAKHIRVNLYFISGKKYCCVVIAQNINILDISVGIKHRRVFYVPHINDSYPVYNLLCWGDFMIEIFSQDYLNTAA